MEILVIVVILAVVVFLIRAILKGNKKEDGEIIHIQDRINTPSFDHTSHEYTCICGEIEVNYAKLSSFNEGFLTLLKKYAQEGWELYRIETVWEHQKYGCLGSILGWNISRVPHQVFIFRKKKSAPNTQA